MFFHIKKSPPPLPVPNLHRLSTLPKSSIKGCAAESIKITEKQEAHAHLTSKSPCCRGQPGERRQNQDRSPRHPFFPTPEAQLIWGPWKMQSLWIKNLVLFNFRRWRCKGKNTPSLRAKYTLKVKVSWCFENMTSGRAQVGRLWQRCPWFFQAA